MSPNWFKQIGTNLPHRMPSDLHIWRWSIIPAPEVWADHSNCLLETVPYRGDVANTVSTRPSRSTSTVIRSCWLHVLLVRWENGTSPGSASFPQTHKPGLRKTSDTQIVGHSTQNVMSIPQNCPKGQEGTLEHKKDTRKKLVKLEWTLEFNSW